VLAGIAEAGFHPKPLERAAEDVGREVRRTMVKISGRRPEELPPAGDIKEVHKKLKSSHREIKKLDGPKE
jgi:DNA-damage-inducible protein D